MKRIAQWSIYLTLGTVGFAAFLILCGEDTPGQPMSDKVFLGSKLAAGAVLYLCVLAGKYFNRRGLLPEFKDPEEEEAGMED